MRPRALSATAAAILLLTGCTESTPTGPSPESVAGVWAGTFDNSDFQLDCDALAAEATLQQDGNRVQGSWSTEVNRCGLVAQTFEGTLSGGTLDGNATDPVHGRVSVRGKLSGSALEIVLGVGVNTSGGGSVGYLHLHR